MSQFIIVSFYTRGSGYKEHAMQLMRSARPYGYQVYLEGKRHRGSWAANCREKPEFIADCLEFFKRPVLWVDADGEIKERLAWAEKAAVNPSFDFWAYLKPNLELRSGTLLFRPTAQSLNLLRLWSEEASVRSMDHRALTQAWNMRKDDVRRGDLPLSMVKIADIDEGHASIEHHQASRSLRKGVNQTLPQMHAMVIGAPRTGTTMMANIMNNPRERRYFMIEPHIWRGGVLNGRIQADMRELGLDYSDVNWAIRDILLDFERKGFVWGVKEVFGGNIVRELQRFLPAKIVLIHRDMRHAVLSLEERQVVVGRGTYGQLWDGARSICNVVEEMFNTPWITKDAKTKPANFNFPMPYIVGDDQRLILVSYDRLISEEREGEVYREELSRLLGFPLDGYASRGMHLWGRTYERERHDGDVTARSTRQRSRQWEKEKGRLHAKLLEMPAYRRYQELFGYPL